MSGGHGNKERSEYHAPSSCGYQPPDALSFWVTDSHEGNTMSSIIPSAVPTSMSSREIAELTGKQHAHIMRDIRAMVDRLKADSNLNWHCETETYVDAKGESREQYALDRNMTLTLITQYSPAARMAVFSQIEHINLREILSNFDAQDLPPDRFVYVAMERESKRYKVGISKYPEKRVECLSRCHPEGLVLMAVYAASHDGYLSELAAHQQLSQWRLNGEWFSSDAPVYQLQEVLCR